MRALHLSWLRMPKSHVMLDSHMHRLTARLLLFLVALGVFQPLLEAFSAEPPHACCLRRLHAQKNQPLQLQDSAKPNGNCCPPLITPHTANLTVCGTVSFSPYVAVIRFAARNDSYRGGTAAVVSTRAPPAPALS